MRDQIQFPPRVSNNWQTVVARNNEKYCDVDFSHFIIFSSNADQNLQEG